ncbi:MAG: hypothetical protein ABI175_29825, partial [Polyangiales bacterium]
MKRPSFRVFVTKHHGGLVSAVLLRRRRVMFDQPPPAAMAEDVDTALARLAPQAALLVEDNAAARYMWSEELELRRIDVDIHPGRPDPRGYVIAKAMVPIRLGYAAAKLDGAPLYRVLVPRFDYSFVTEDLDTALARLAPQAALLVEDNAAARYTWSEDLELRRIDVDIHPGRPDPRGYVIAKAMVPIRLGYAAATLDGAPLYRVLVPRFDYSFVTEDL